MSEELERQERELEVHCAEGEFKTAVAAEVLNYGHVNSCLTVTAYLSDGSRVGAHVGMKKPIVNLLTRLATASSGKTVNKIEVRGALDSYDKDMNPVDVHLQTHQEEFDEYQMDYKQITAYLRTVYALTETPNKKALEKALQAGLKCQDVTFANVSEGGLSA